jgi:hypothetical protein
MPSPVTTYITRAITRSHQPRPQPQATGTAVNRAANGTAMNTASTIDSPRFETAGSRCGSTARRCSSGLSAVRGAVWSAARVD